MESIANREGDGGRHRRPARRRARLGVRWRRASWLLVVALWLGGAPPRGVSAAGRSEIRGVVELVDGRGHRVTGDVTEGVVWFVPEGGVDPPTPGSFEMATQRKRFAPRVLVVPLGSTVRFPNRDPILHNVFSVSSGNSFDLGLLARGENGEAQLADAGIVRVFCNVHHSMIGYVAVMATPYFARPDVRGQFVLAGLPAGPGELFVWHERGEPVRRRVTAGADGVLDLPFEVTRPLVPPHLNKLGRPYSRSPRDRY